MIKNIKDAVVHLKSAVHVEVTLRIGFAMLLGYTVTFSDIMPIDTSVLLGILVPFCAMLFPTLTFAYGSLVLPLFGLFLFCYVSSTLLLAIAAVGGNGPFLAAFGIWCFWVAFLRWDKGEGFKTSVILIVTIFQIVLIWPNYGTVINGCVLPNPHLSPAVREALTDMIQPTVNNATALGPGTHLVDIISGGLQGQTAQITIKSDGSEHETFIEGGMWIVRAMWTSSGIRNPLASYQSVMIFICWLIAILAVIFFIPPFRTVRSALCKSIIPAALKEAANSLRLFSKRMETQNSASDGEIELARIETQNSASGVVYRDIDKERMDSISKLNTYINTLFEGNLAKYTVYEPRLLAFKPPECTMEILVQLSQVTSRCLRIAYGIDVLTSKDDEYGFLHKNRKQYEDLAATIEQCAQALSSSDASLIDKLKVTQSEPIAIAHEAGANSSVDNAEPYDPLELKKYVSDVAALTRRWLETMEPFNKRTPHFFSHDSFIGFLKNLRPWIYAQISHVVYLVQVLKECCKPSVWQLFLRMDRYELQKLVWCVKYAIGFTALLAMSCYWPEYQQNFVVSSRDDPNRGIYSFQNGGWAMASYCFATTQTTEGSVKKGILRMAGTIIGAFSAWLALLVCEDDRYSRQYNTVGIVAWMTITSVIATYISTERGFSARIGLSNDYAFGPIYFLITQIIIVCNAFYFFGPEGRDAMTINRMLSNLVGILMSTILALIPPGNWGGDPGHCKAMIKHHWNLSTEAIRLLLSCGLTPDGEPVEDQCKQKAAVLMELREQTIRQSAKMQELVVDFEKDAVRLNKFPLFQVDPKLKAVIGNVTRDVHIAAYVPQVAARILLNPQSRNAALGNESSGRKELERLLGDMERDICPGKDRVPLNIESDAGLTDGEIDLELFLRTVCFFTDAMKAEEKELSSIKWGF